jgi:two-component system sensor histidine kinase PilS (NtrC family)
MVDNALRRKLAWLITIRAVVSTVLLGGAVIAQLTAPGSFPVDPFFFLIAITYGLTIVYAATVRAAGRHRWLIDLQLGGDALIVSAFIYFTGGITSLFSSLYVLPIMAAGAVQFRRGGLMVAVLSTLLYGGIVLVQYMMIRGPWQDPWLAAVALPPRSVTLYTLALNVFGFFSVALLSGSLAESVRSAGARLAQASTAIADLQALNQHVIDSLASGLATTDADLRVLTFNRTAEVITGVTAGAAIGRPLADLLQLPTPIVAAVEQGIGASGARRLEFRYRTEDGRGEIDIGLSATPLAVPGAPVGVLVNFQDLTDVKKLERDARMQQRLAAVGEMAAGIAHEIRNPLASMSGSIQILRHELPLSTEQEQLMDIVLRESERLNSTIGSFLAYARPRRFAIERFDVRSAINDTALLLRNGSEAEAHHRIDVAVPEGPVWYEADEGQIKQILWNLATNGLRAMPDGGRLLLTCTTDGSSGNVVIAVQDEGIGIEPEELDGLFQPFNGRFSKGSGLGLAIVHRIVTDYGGEIHVNSRRGAGTTVSVRFPVQAGVTAT